MTEATTQETPELDTKEKVKLNTIQGVGVTIEQRIEDARMQIHVRKGVVAGLIAGKQEVINTMAELQRLIDLDEKDPNRVDGDAAKPILGWLQKAAERCDTAAAMNQREMSKAEGIVEGLSKAVDVCEELHKREVAKLAQRATMVEHGERFGRDTDGRPLPLKERYGNGAAEQQAAHAASLGAPIPEPAKDNAKGKKPTGRRRPN